MEKFAFLHGSRGQLLLLAESCSAWFHRAKCLGCGKWAGCIFPSKLSCQNRQLQEPLQTAAPARTECDCHPHQRDTSTVKHQLCLCLHLWQEYEASPSFSWPSQQAEPKHHVILPSLFPLLRMTKIRWKFLLIRKRIKSTHWTQKEGLKKLILFEDCMT